MQCLDRPNSAISISRFSGLNPMAAINIGISFVI
jgi:hypothetical protein